MTNALKGNLETSISRRDFLSGLGKAIGGASVYGVLGPTDASACMSGKPDAFYNELVQPKVDNPKLLQPDSGEKVYVKIDAREGVLVDAMVNPEKFRQSGMAITGHLYPSLDDAIIAKPSGANTYIVEIDGFRIPTKIYNSEGFKLPYSFARTRSLTGCGLIIKKD